MSAADAARELEAMLLAERGSFRTGIEWKDAVHNIATRRRIEALEYALEAISSAPAASQEEQQ